MTVVDALRGIVRLGLDANVFISFVQPEQAYHPLCVEFFRRIDSGAPPAATCAITLTETLVRATKASNAFLIRAYEDLLTPSDNLDILPATIAVAKRAAELRALYDLKTPDTLQVAAALSAGCDAFLTGDKRLSRVTELNVLVLGDLTL